MRCLTLFVAASSLFLSPWSGCSSQGQSTSATPTVAPLAADTPRTTVGGNPFIAPVGWTVETRGAATVLTPPEGGSWVSIVDVQAADADAAVAASWKAYRPDAKWPLKVATDAPDKDGWSNQREYTYQTSPNEKRSVAAYVKHAANGWTVVILDMADAVQEKRLGQISLVFDRLLPKGYTRETFANKQAARLDAAKLAELSRFVEQGRQRLGIPGVSIGVVQDGQVVLADGFGVRDITTTVKPDADTLYMIASNTKALTTLMLAKLLDEGKLSWDTPVTSLLPTFALGNADTTRQVQVKHLICACTGLPRQDFEWLFQFAGVTPEAALKTLATMQPTSKFGELFQYSNPMAAAGGFVGGHVAYPSMELGAAYDQAMATRVFAPLGMNATTFDYARALRGNHAEAHGPGFDMKPARAVMELNYSIIPMRPAGAGWSSVRDMLKYVRMELDEGLLPNKQRYISASALLARRQPQVAIGREATYGMGLMVDTKYETPVVHHGGDMIGYHSDMLWLPEYKVGAVILTNADPGWLLRGPFGRKLLELLFDGRSEAEADVNAAAKTFFDRLAADHKLLTAPADPGLTEQLASRYTNPALGDIAVAKSGASTVFDFGEWKSAVASRRNPDGSVSFITIDPGADGFEFVVAPGATPALVIRDAQHEYTFTAQPGSH
jgi:CubicO group peptidase (beta-lactamase class C family)